jgi:hypothetical protein
MSEKLFQCKRPRLKHGQRWGRGILVTFPVSIRYNGGTVINGEWYAGYDVPAPSVPKGFEFVGIGIGLQLNDKPPYATQLLREKKEATT